MAGRERPPGVGGRSKPHARRAIFQPFGALKIAMDKFGRIAAIVAVVVGWRDEVTARLSPSAFITPSDRRRQVPHLAA